MKSDLKYGIFKYKVINSAFDIDILLEICKSCEYLPPNARKIIWEALVALVSSVEKVIRTMGILVMGEMKYDQIAQEITDELEWLFPKALYESFLKLSKKTKGKSWKMGKSRILKK